LVYDLGHGFKGHKACIQGFLYHDLGLDEMLFLETDQQKVFPVAQRNTPWSTYPLVLIQSCNWSSIIDLGFSLRPSQTASSLCTSTLTLFSQFQLTGAVVCIDLGSSFDGAKVHI
jgi:hypothetical protein